MNTRLVWVKPCPEQAPLRDLLMPGLVDLKLCLVLQNRRGSIVYAANIPKPWIMPDSQRHDDAGVFGPEIAERLALVKGSLSTAGDKGLIEVMMGHEQIFEFRVQAVAADGGEIYYLTAIVDRSEERHRERLLKALLREVSHRSKNLLAIIQSLALQTARHSRSLDLFLQKFRGRLYSLSQSQDLITDSSWRGAEFFELVRQQTDKYLPENSDLVHVSGENVMLSPNASLHLGLALHELVVNAVIHGGLLISGKPVEVSCRRIGSGEDERIEIVWNEPLSAVAHAAQEKREAHFGSTVLERVVPASVNGTAHYSIDENLIRYELDFPAESGE